MKILEAIERYAGTGVEDLFNNLAGMSPETVEALEACLSALPGSGGDFTPRITFTGWRIGEMAGSSPASAPGEQQCLFTEAP
jgi:hypothetical protein